MSDRVDFIGRVTPTYDAKIEIAIAKLADDEIEISENSEFEYAFGPYVFLKKFLPNNTMLLYLIRAVEGKEAELLRILKISPNFLSKDLNKTSAIDLYFEFMEIFGLPVPEIGGKKYLIDEEKQYFVMGDLDGEKYQDALSSEGLLD